MKPRIKAETLREIIRLIDERIGSIPPVGTRQLNRIRLWKTEEKK